MKRNKDFSPQLAEKVLLWCERHCCLCGKQCSLHIELHHIDPNGGAEEDNCMPVCYQCHGELSHYDPKQPRGRRFRDSELKKRRDQIYEQHTGPLLPPIEFEIACDTRGLPFARFIARHQGVSPPVKATIELTPFIDGKKSTLVRRLHYHGDVELNLNPQAGFNGWFEIRQGAAEYKKQLLVQVNAAIIDPYERTHRLLPFGFCHLREPEGWYYEPAPEAARLPSRQSGTN